MTDKEKMLHILECSDNLTFEEIINMYFSLYSKDFSILRMTNFIDSFNKNHFYPKIAKYSELQFVANERAAYLKNYLEGKMWKDEETAKKYLQPQIDNAQAIIDVCNEV